VKAGVAARVATATALQGILDDGRHSNLVVDSVRGGLSTEDASQVQRVVLATIRHLTGVDAVLDSLITRPLGSLDPEVRAVLRAGVTELLVDRGDPHGVVDSAVEAVRAMGRPTATGFVNATLRRLGRERVELSGGTMAQWIVDRMTEQFGPQAGPALTALDEPAERGIRVRRGDLPAAATPVAGITGAGYLRPGEMAETDSIDFIDPASTAVALAAEVRPGMRVLDVASAPGGKTAALWDAMEGDGLLVAADVSRPRLEMARRRLTRMSVSPRWVVADGTAPPFRPGSFDVVLLDAPCSGLGTLRRRPEIRHRLRPSDPERLGRLQTRLIEASLPLLAPGGRLVYAVCTLFAEETTDVVARFAAAPPSDVPGVVWGNGLLLAPHTTDTDGMFISIIG
jgi:16S rRNA (cytosine967-C5)-methyltransferase